MSNLPKIYATCKAGCQWETVHRSEFEASASHIRQVIDENGICYLQKGKEYKIFAAKKASNKFTCSVVFAYKSSSTKKTFTITHTNDDKYAESFVFRLLDATVSGSTLTLVYEMAGVRYTETISGTSLTLLTENYLYVSGATSVLLYNADATIVAVGEKGEKGEKGDAGDSHADTKVTLTVTDGYLLDLRSVYNLENHGGCTAVDWGDGTITEIQGLTDNEMKHTYTTGGTYTVILVGVKDITRALFNEKNVIAVEIGGAVERICDYAFGGNTDLTEATIYAKTPPTIYTVTSSLNPFGNSPIEKIYVYDNTYLTANGWSALADKLYFDFSQGGGVPEELQAQIDQNTTDIATLKASVGAGGSVDTSKTIFTVEIADSALYLDFRSVWTNCVGATHVDWGDGNENDITIDDDLRHTYATAGTYKISVTGITEIGNIAFKEKLYITKVAIGDTVTSIGNYAFTGCSALTEVTFNSIIPPKFTGGNQYRTFDTDYVKKMYIPKGTLFAYRKAYSWVVKDSLGNVIYKYTYANVLDSGEYDTVLITDKTVTVGANGDFATINEAIDYLSFYSPIYKKGGMKCEIKILDGTVIDEQIIVERLDLSYITITTDNANNTVTVTPTTANWSKSTLTHDTRGNVPFFGGEFGARLPVIKCLFSATSPTVTLDDNAVGIVGYYCNRGSTGVIAGETTYTGSDAEALANVGFEGFYDNIIANNNSEIVLREAIARNAERYGVMSRHISRVSARSADITGCKECAAYADRASMMDVRHADLSGSKNGIQSYNASVITANETKANNITGLVADAQAGSILNAELIDAQNSANIFAVSMGGQIVAKNAKTTGATGTIYNVTVNTLTANGVIFD